MDKKLEKYGKSKDGNFEVVDTIGVPHPYCITPKHVATASDKFMGMLGREAIIQAEEDGAMCDICNKASRREGKKILSYDEHKQALLLSCKEEIKDNKELHKFLMSIKEMAIKDSFEGFAFKKDF
jgi:hypothetical protein